MGKGGGADEATIRVQLHRACHSNEAGAGESLVGLCVCGGGGGKMGTRVVNDLNTLAKRRSMFSCIVCGKGTRDGWTAGLVSWKLVGICGCVGQGVGVHDLNTLTKRRSVFKCRHSGNMPQLGGGGG